MAKEGTPEVARRAPKVWRRMWSSPVSSIPARRWTDLIQARSNRLDEVRPASGGDGGDRTAPHPPPHLRRAPGDLWGAFLGHPGADGPQIGRASCRERV